MSFVNQTTLIQQHFGFVPAHLGIRKVFQSSCTTDVQ